MVMLGRPVGLSILRVLGLGLFNTHPVAGSRTEGSLEDQLGVIAGGIWGSPRGYLSACTWAGPCSVMN